MYFILFQRGRTLTKEDYAKGYAATGDKNEVINNK